MKNIVYVMLACLVMVFIIQDVNAAQRKKKKNSPTSGMQQTPRKQPSAYERLFQGKQVTVAEGVMKMYSLKEHGRDKIYVEFPLRLLEKDMMLTSSIEEISDSGEGAVGQFNNFIQLRFSRLDSVLLLRLITGSEPVAELQDSSLRKAFDKAAQPGVWQVIKILAYSPDSSAVVVDMSRLFMDHTEYTNPFAAFAGNSMGGFSERIPRPRPDKTVLKGIKAYQKSLMVTGDYHYFVDHKYMGQQVFRKNVPVSVTVNRILMLLPEEVMKPRYADMRVGVTMLNKISIQSADKGFKQQPYTMRWRLEPSDPEKYGRGELVEPKKPIVFYLDTLVPVFWKKAAIEAAEAWNPVFEKIGFKNVIRVTEFPKDDPDFNACSIEHSVIRYAPTSLAMAQNSMHADIRSGEIINASILLHNGIGIRFNEGYKSGTLGLDPAACSNADIPEAICCEALKVYLMSVFGNALGLTENFSANAVFPLDSLRSPSFTQKYGICPSIMSPFRYNLVVRPEDVARGVRLIPQGPGVCDYFTIKWLYTPLPEAKTAADEVPVLEKWVAEEEKNPNYRFAFSNRLMIDPKFANYIPGDDQLKAVQAYLQNVKRFMANLNEWYREGDEDYSIRQNFYRGQTAQIPVVIRTLLNYVGGFQAINTAQGTIFEFVPKERQREVVKYALGLLEDFKWLEIPELEKEAGLMESPRKMLTWGILAQLIDRTGAIFFSEEKNKDGYTSKEFTEDLYRAIWKPTLEGRVLTEMERSVQIAFLGCIVTSSDVAIPSPGMNRGPGQQAGRAPQQSMIQLGEVYGYDDYGFDSQQGQIASELYVPAFSSLKVSRYPVQHWYFDMLLKTKEIIRKAVSNSSGTTRMHYEYMLLKINDVLDIN